LESEGASFSVSALFESTTTENESLRSGKGEEAWLSALADGPVCATASSRLECCWLGKEGLRVGLEGEAEGGGIKGVLGNGISKVLQSVRRPLGDRSRGGSGRVQDLKVSGKQGGVRLARIGPWKTDQ
jgi:hypothetical protein